ncbi:MAG: glycoside hydrolase family 3 C-terminal domain-containing protein [Eubacteriales bacterium]|nr:glycoside hydrolase family 3 C-terminal domain-containing protein [Eubacteriales bacterium]
MAEIYALRSPEITEAEKAHMALARGLAGECPVLLENEGVLPLKEKGNIALYGAGARGTIKGGTGSGDVNTRMTVTVEQGLAEAGYTIVTTDWIERNANFYKQKKQEYLAWAAQKAKEENIPDIVVALSYPFSEPGPVVIEESEIKADETDTAIYVISRNSGEGADRFCKEGDYLLFPEEKENLTILGQNYKKVVVVLNIGGVMDVTEIKAIPGIGAILLMTQLGNIGGYVLADVLSGDVTPSGKLTDTWAVDYKDYPSSEGFSHNDGNIDDEYYTEGIYVGYRYFDSFGVKAVYPFGYGKSYTDFALKVVSAEQKGAEIEVSVSVTNTGNEYSGKEVVQVYYSAPAGNLEKPYQELVAYAKTSLLAPGQEETLKISFAIADMASYCEKCASWVLEKGDYIVRVGNSSKDTVAAAKLVLEETVKTEELKNLFAKDAEFEEISCQAKAADEETAFTLKLDASAIPINKAVYQGKREEYHTDKTEKLTVADIQAGRCTVEELVAQLTVEELADYCVGTLRSEEGSIVGNASYTVPGAAGDSSSLLKEERGIKNMILADGPAGLRLQPHFKTDKAGNLLPGGEVFGDSFAPFDPNLKEEETDDYYQYCTAIPIGWALAQSWNTELLEKAGDMVGEEMELFHVDLWLAPAMNIHRNPLCGRNFEYYSEDPLVSGKTAAAITKGVQSHPGKGTTIKHFAVNSQEDNRYFANSHVSERALREIYLKGFEIAVKESQPLSIMTSYNLINGIHAANCYDLLQGAARDEWGFQGVVMTDWFTSQDVPGLTGGHKAVYPISASTGCVYAGNDMQMPGCKKNVDDLVASVKEDREIDGFKITLADLQFNAANVIRVAAKMK